MNYFNLVVLVVGSGGMLAQLLLLRQLFVIYSANEMTLGILLANWILAEASGVIIFGGLIDKIKDKLRLFLRLLIAFSVVLPVSIFFARDLKNLAGLPFGETIGFFAVFISSLLLLFPAACSHGALFSCAVKIYSLKKDDAAVSLGVVYTWETIGSVVGGLILTYIFIPYFDPLEATLLVSFTSLAVSLPLENAISYRKLKLLTLGLVLSILYLFSSGNLRVIKDLSLKNQYPGLSILEEKNSVYGNIAVTSKAGQHTFFYNGTPLISSPYPDIAFVEDFGNIPLLFHPSPKSLFIIGRGAGGLINEFLKYPLKRIDYAELDPSLIEMLEKYPTSLTASELSDKRVRVIKSDGRFYLRNSELKYDIIIIGLSEPTDLSVNRFFTEEFFLLASKKLNAGGILGFWLPSSLTYLSQELTDLHSSILEALKRHFPYLRIIPGDFNIFLASSSKAIIDTDVGLISQRLAQNNITTRLLLPAYLEYRLDKKWSDWYLTGMKRAKTGSNQDLKPIAIFKSLKFSEKRLIRQGGLSLLSAMENLNLRVFSILILALTLLLYASFRLKVKTQKMILPYCIFTTGFFAMTVNLILIFAFQVFYGNLYYAIGILESIFMAGLAAGSAFMGRKVLSLKSGINLFRALELALVLFPLFLVSVLGVKLFFAGLFFAAGALAGLEFPLAGKLFFKDNNKLGSSSGLLYGADLLGGWLSGIFAGVVLIPLLGVLETCILVSLLKLSSLFLLINRDSDSFL